MSRLSADGILLITWCGSSFLDALCKPRDAALRGVRVEKKQVNSPSLAYCVSESARFIFLNIAYNTRGSGFKSCPKSYSGGRQRDYLSAGCVAVCNTEPGFWSVLPVIYFHFSGLSAYPQPRRFFTPSARSVRVRRGHWF